jgi:hypothetical protein
MKKMNKKSSAKGFAAASVCLAVSSAAFLLAGKLVLGAAMAGPAFLYAVLAYSNRSG